MDPEESRTEMNLIEQNTKSKNEIDYALFSARRILKDGVPSFNIRSDHRVLRGRKHIILAAEKMDMDVPSQRKMPAGIDEKK